MNGIENIFGNVYFDRSPVFDLLAAMFRVQNHELLKPETKGAGKYLPDDLENWVKRIRSSLSEELRGELEIFFDYDNFPGFGLLDLAFRSNKHRNLKDFFDFLEGVSADDIIHSFFKAGYLESREGMTEIKKITSSREALEFLKKRKMPEKEKWKLLYFFCSKEETKERFIYLLRQFYYDYFHNEIEKISLIQYKSIHELKREFKNEKEKKFKLLLNFDYRPLQELNQIIFIPSYYLNTSFIITYDDMSESLIYLYGVERPWLVLNHDNSNVMAAFKILSHDKRLQIIQILKKRPCYGAELVEKIKLANSTISHHLSILSDHGIVLANREENKVYYEVVPERIEEILEGVKENLI